MKIRSITSFHDPGLGATLQIPQKVVKFNQTAKAQFTQGGYTVQTTRLATTPFPGWYKGLSDPLGSIQDMEKAATSAGFEYLAIGPAFPASLESFEFILPVLENTSNVFMGGMMAESSTGISLQAVKACARVVAGAACMSPDGFTNLHFSALANVKPFGPFFPSAYAGSGAPAFSLAMECADEILGEFSRAGSLAKARENLLEKLNEEGKHLAALADEMQNEYGVEFKGIDFSCAPFPEDLCSAGGALEQLGIEQLGMAGSVAAAAFLADTLDRGEWKKAGFNGLMLPVLEDSVLARRSCQPLTLKDMLLFSAVCGTGLDTIPLPGSITQEQLEGILLDVATLSMRLAKPLTARLMPVPGKSAGELTGFDFAYFSNGRVMDLTAGQLKGFLAGNEVIDIQPRTARL